MEDNCRFIEVAGLCSGDKILINTACIVTIESCKVGCMIVLNCSVTGEDLYGIEVCETLDAVKDKIYKKNNKIN